MSTTDTSWARRAAARPSNGQRREILIAAAGGRVIVTESGQVHLRTGGQGSYPRRCDRVVRALVDEGLLVLDGDRYKPTGEVPQ